MHKIHTFGCSFTQYSYPTWADFIQMHYTDIEVINQALPGYGNDIIKKQLNLLDKSEHVLIMFTGCGRESNFFDYNFCKTIDLHDENFKTYTPFTFEDLDGYFLPIKKYFTIENKVESFTNIIWKNLETILDCQNILLSKKIPFTTMAWADLTSASMLTKKLNDTQYYKEVFKTKNPKHDGITNNKYSQTVIESIEKNNWIQDVKTGLFERHWQDKNLVLKQPNHDAHPTSLGHYFYFIENIKPILDQKFENKQNESFLLNSTHDLVNYLYEMSDQLYKESVPSHEKNGWNQSLAQRKNNLIKNFYNYG